MDQGDFYLRSLEVQSGLANRKNGAASRTSLHRRLSRVSSCSDAKPGLLIGQKDSRKNK
jgi:hypothetical protein